MNVRDTIASVLLAHGISPDFSSPHAAHAIDKLESLATEASGPWQYKSARGNSRKHPLRKVLAELDRLEHAIQEAKRAAECHGKLDEVNASEKFFWYVETFTQNDAFRLIRAMRQGVDGALDLGRERPGNAPLLLRRDAYLVEMFFLLMAHRGNVEFDEGFVKIAHDCQAILPVEDHETHDELRDRLAKVRERHSALFMRWVPAI